MASCEKCWGDAYMRIYSNPSKSQSEHYGDLIHERKENQCTPEEQAGSDAKMCPKCERTAIHQIIGRCMNCGYEIKK